MKTYIAILISMVCATALPQAIQKNPYTTNLTAAADAHALSLFSGTVTNPYVGTFTVTDGAGNNTVIGGGTATAKSFTGTIAVTGGEVHATSGFYGDGANITSVVHTNSSGNLLNSAGADSGLNPASVVTTNQFQLTSIGQPSPLIIVSNAVGGNADVIGIYHYAGLLNGVSTNGYYTNDTTGMLLVSNYYNQAGSWKGAFTNAGHVWYRSGSSMASTWFTVDGTAPTPTPVWLSVGFTNTANLHSNITTPYSIFCPENTSNNTIYIENFGDDIQGIAGFYPFLTLQSALSVYSFTNYPIRVGVGTFLATNSTALDPNQTISGVGRLETVFTDGVSNTIHNSFLISSGDKIENLAINGVVAPPLNSSATNVVIFNCILGDSNQVDSIFQNGSAYFYGMSVNNCDLVANWDTTAGCISGTFSDCNLILTAGTLTNTTGAHGYGPPAGKDCSYTVNGGTVQIKSTYSKSDGVASSTNACVWIINTSQNTSIKLNGPKFTYPSSNCFAIYNYGGLTNVTGYYYDNGVLTYVSGTNYTQFRSTGITNYSRYP